MFPESAWHVVLQPAAGQMAEDGLDLAHDAHVVVAPTVAHAAHQLLLISSLLTPYLCRRLPQQENISISDLI